MAAGDTGSVIISAVYLALLIGAIYGVLLLFKRLLHRMAGIERASIIIHAIFAVIVIIVIYYSIGDLRGPAGP